MRYRLVQEWQQYSSCLESRCKVILNKNTHFYSFFVCIAFNELINLCTPLLKILYMAHLFYIYLCSFIFLLFSYVIVNFNIGCR